MKKFEAEKYTYRIAWSEEDKAHVARCLEFPSLGAHGSTSGAALREIQSVVADIIDWLYEEKEKIPEPLGLHQFKGNVSLRILAEVHRDLVVRSREEGVSLNKFILSKLSNPLFSHAPIVGAGTGLRSLRGRKRAGF